MPPMRTFVSEVEDDWPARGEPLADAESVGACATRRILAEVGERCAEAEPSPMAAYLCSVRLPRWRYLQFGGDQLAHGGNGGRACCR